MRRALQVLSLLVFAGMLAGPAAGQYLVPPHSVVEGKSLEEWSADWWKWALSLPRTGHPWWDETGQDAYRGQTGSVFYLLGVNNQAGTATRWITLPTNTWLFFPIINFAAWSHRGDPWDGLEGLRDGVLTHASKMIGLEASLNGVPFTNMVYTSGHPITNLFDHLEIAPEHSAWLPPTDNVFQFWGTDYAGLLDPATAAGYWLMLAPLPPGEHELRFIGRQSPLGGYEFTLEVTYWITIDPSQPFPRQEAPRAKATAGPPDSSLKEGPPAIAPRRTDAAEAPGIFLEYSPGRGVTKLARPAGASRAVGGNPQDSTGAPSLRSGRFTPRIVKGSSGLGGSSPFSRSDFWYPNGTVHAVLETNGVVYLGGIFDLVSPPNPQTSALLDLFSGTPDPDWPRMNGPVEVALADGGGGWFVGGQFTAAGDVRRLNLVHLLPDKSVDPDWKPDPDGVVRALVLSGDTLYVGGAFSSVGGQPRGYLAAVNAGTGAVTDWNPQAEDSMELKPPELLGVHAMVLAHGLMYVAGAFDRMGGQFRENLAALDLRTGQPTEWYPIVYFPAEAGQRLQALAVFGNTVYVGSDSMQLLNRTPRGYVAAFDATQRTNSLTAWNPDANGPVSAILVSCEAVYVAGSFTTIGGQARPFLAALDPVSGQATGWQPQVNGPVKAMVLVGSTLYISGDFTSAGGQSRRSLAALDLVSGLAGTWSPQVEFRTEALAVAGGSIVVGGQPGGVARRNLAALDAATGEPTSWDPSPNSWVYALARAGHTVYVGGDFTTIGGRPRNRLAAVDAVTGEPTSWNPNVNGIERTSAIVECLVISGSTVYVSGTFTNIGTTRRARLAALDLASGQVLPWNPEANDDVRVLEVADGTVYAGGRFTQIGGALRRRLAALEAWSGLATPFDPMANDAVRDLVVVGDTVFAGGLFSVIGGRPRAHLAALDSFTGLATEWDPGAENTNLIGKVEMTSLVNGLALAGETIRVGGLFNRISGEPRANLAALDLASGLATPWNPVLDLPAITVPGPGDTAYVGGKFKNVDGRFQPYFAVFPPVGAPVILRQPRSQRVQENTSVSLSVEVVGQEPLAFQWQHDGTDLPGATSSNLFLSAAQTSHSGNYTVVASNSLGRISSQAATLIVLQPIVILAQPASQTVSQGALVTLGVVAEGHPPPAYQWQLNGVNIPGASSPTLTIPNAQPADGGSYSVVVANPAGAVPSEVAILRIEYGLLPFEDNLGAHVTVFAPFGLGSGANVIATKEPGETNHVGKAGGHSLWLGWVAPASGIATFGTRGSDFDTLLAIYTNTAGSSLAEVASDEDRGGFLTSRASFYARAGMKYLVAVDGFAGASGNVVLSWSLETNTVPFPVILTQPLSESTVVGSNVTFFVDVHSETTESYQWHFGCAPIAGATNRTLTVTDIQMSEVGDYYVVVRNNSSYAAQSLNAALEIGPDPTFVSQAKPADLFPELLSRSFAGQTRISPRADLGGSGFISVAMGTIGSQTINNANGQTGAPLCCGAAGGSAKWLRLRFGADGLCEMDTAGSTIVPLVAVYFDTNLTALYRCASLVVCTNNGRLVRFNARRATDYLVVADGANGARGLIKLKWKFGWPIPPASGFTTLANADGSITLMSGATNGAPYPSYQWFYNGVKIPGATNSSWRVLSPATVPGTYTVLASNFFGGVVQTAELVELKTTPHFSRGRLELCLPPGLSQAASVQWSSNLADWILLQTLNPAQGNCLEVPLTNSPKRFFRVLSVP